MGHKNQAADWIGPVSHSLLTCGLDTYIEGLQEFSEGDLHPPSSSKEGLGYRVGMG